jgi:small conductance mechanosensitive channel
MMKELSFESFIPWLLNFIKAAGEAGLHIAMILVVGFLGIRFVRLGMQQLERVITLANEPGEEIPGTAHKRAATLTGILRTIALAMIWAIVVIEILHQVGLDIRPILAGAGILGLAVGFGAQNIVRDLISGFFIILEDQVRLGDVAVINGTGGLVESITFRITTLRDFSGVVHIFPNGTITTLSNMTMDWSAFVLDMGVAYKEDTDRVVEVMRQVGEELREDPEFQDKFVSPIEIVGVDKFADSAVVIQIRIKTKPLEQWNVGREYRRRLKRAFDANGIEIPFPHRSLYAGSSSEPFKVQVVPAPATVR